MSPAASNPPYRDSIPAATANTRAPHAPITTRSTLASRLDALTNQLENLGNRLDTLANQLKAASTTSSYSAPLNDVGFEVDYDIDGTPCVHWGVKSPNGYAQALSTAPHYPQPENIVYTIEVPGDELTHEELGDFIGELLEFHRTYPPAIACPPR